MCRTLSSSCNRFKCTQNAYSNISLWLQPIWLTFWIYFSSLSYARCTHISIETWCAYMRYALNNRMNMRKRRIIVAAAGIQFNRNIDSLINQNTAYEKKRIYGMRDGCDCNCNVCKTQNYFYGINRMAPTTIYPHIYSIPSIERQTYHNKCMQCNRNVNFSSADMYTLFLRFDS